MSGRLVIMSGSPLSGKSTAAKMLAEMLGADALIFSTDETRRQLTGSYSDRSKEKEVWELITKGATEHLKRGGISIIDATMRQKKLREAHLDHYKEWPIFYIAFEKIPLETIAERNISRKSKSLDEETLKRLWQEYELPDEEELSRYSASVVINNQNSAVRIAELSEKILIEK
jgi:predicted kinase